MLTAILIILVVWSTVGGAKLAWDCDNQVDHGSLNNWWSLIYIFAYGPSLWLLYVFFGTAELFDYLSSKVDRKLIG